MKKNKYETIAFVQEGRPLIKDLNPKIQKVIIDFDFSDNYEYSQNAYSVELHPTDKAFFAIDCINHSCTKGYMTISQDLETIAKNEKLPLYGKMVCDGWQAQSKRGNHRCKAVIKYKIKIKSAEETQ